MNDPLTLIQIAVGLLSFWTGVCRAQRMDSRTRNVIVYTMMAFAAAGLGLVAAPFVPEYSRLFLVAYAVTAVSMQFATSHLWKRGVPRPFQR